MRRTHNRPSLRNAAYPKPSRKFKISQRLIISVGLVLLCSTLGAIWLLSRKSTIIAGVPAPIIVKALKDGPARSYFLIGNKRAFHDRLEKIGVKEDIKTFYRPQIPDEIKLDQYIHQIFYNDTGFVGDGYYLNSERILVLRNPLAAVQGFDQGFSEWYQLAREAGVVVGSKKENGVQYVISPTGRAAPYTEVAAVFSIDELRNLTRMKQK